LDGGKEGEDRNFLEIWKENSRSYLVPISTSLSQSNKPPPPCHILLDKQLFNLKYDSRICFEQMVIVESKHVKPTYWQTKYIVLQQTTVKNAVLTGLGTPSSFNIQQSNTVEKINETEVFEYGGNVFTVISHRFFNAQREHVVCHIADKQTNLQFVGCVSIDYLVMIRSLRVLFDASKTHVMISFTNYDKLFKQIEDEYVEKRFP
jgi:hypothetical protein